MIREMLPLDLIAKAELFLRRRDFEMGVNPTLAEDLDEHLSGLEIRRAAGLNGLRTGFDDVDRNLGGLAGLTFLGAGTGVGKTCLALAFAAGAMKQNPNLAVVFVSLEMGKSTLIDRLICSQSGVDYRTLLASNRSSDDDAKIAAGQEVLHSSLLSRMVIVDRGFDQNTFLSIIQGRIQHFLARGAGNVFVVVDYAQLLPIAESSHPLEADATRIRVLQTIQNWGRSPERALGFPVLAISEMRKEKLGDFHVQDLLGSARLGYGADAVLALEPDEKTSHLDKIRVNLRILKGRDGVRRSTVAMVFDHQKSSFEEEPLPSVSLSVPPRMPASSARAPFPGRE
ncbi:MAG: DnaB-like helicase C-terminal domain-containing protein [Planctomycetota bacterium]